MRKLFLLGVMACFVRIGVAESSLEAVGSAEVPGTTESKLRDAPQAEVERALKHSEASVRIAAVRALATRGPRHAGLLEERLYDPDRGVVQEAILGLKKFDSPEATAALTRFSAKALPIFLSESNSADRFLSLQALNHIQALGSYAESALPQLVNKLPTEDYLIRCAAEKAIDGVDTPQGAALFERHVVPLLLNDLTDWDEESRHQALYQLGQLRHSDPRLKDRLLEMTTHEWFPELRQSAIQQVAASKDARLLPVLRDILVKREKALYGAIGEAVSHYGLAASTLTPALTTAFKDTSHPNDYEPLLRALVSIGSPEALAGLQDFKRDRMAQVLSTEPDERARAAYELGLMGPAASAAVPSLRKLLADPNPRMRVAAIQALKKIDTAEARLALADHEAEKIPYNDDFSPDRRAYGEVAEKKTDVPCDVRLKHLRNNRVHSRSALAVGPRLVHREQKKAMLEPGANNVVHLFWTDSESNLPPCDNRACNLYLEVDRFNTIKHVLYTVGSFENQRQHASVSSGKISMNPQEAKKNRFSGNIFLQFDAGPQVNVSVHKNRIANVN